jgi:DNA (cytosine-5)-methyltransferase 1
MLKNIGVIEMKYLSVCSGIEAASAAWHSLGWQAVGFSEIEPFPCSVLEHRFPDVENFGDMTKFKEWDIEPGSVDVLVGGTPCQSFSIAGLRGGLTDGRGNLALTYCQILQKFRPRWFIWENVPGVLSSNGGRDFGSILGAMVELGYGIAYRILDAQYFGVPQRRRRVFVVGCAGDWDRAAKVLFERGCLSGNTAKGRKAKQNVAALTATGVGTCGADDNQGQAGHLIPTTQFGPIAGTLTQRHDSSPCADRGQNVVLAQAFRTAGDGAVYHQGDKTAALTTATDPCTNIITTSTGETAHCLNAGGMGRQDYETETMIVAIQERAVSTNIDNGPQGAGFRDDGKAYTLEARNKVQAVAFTQNQRNEVRELDVIGALQANPGMKQQAYLSQPVGVRRLTPRECERLQGFPDDWTLVSHRGKPAADGPRYKAIGNSMAVPVMRWIGKRIELVKE